MSNVTRRLIAALSVGMVLMVAGGAAAVEPEVAAPASALVPVPAPIAVPEPPVVIQPQGLLSDAIAQRLAAGPAGLDARRPLDIKRLQSFYEARRYAAAWFVETGPGGVGLVPQATVLRRVSAATDAEGLLPADYHPAAIEARLDASDPVRRAELDLLLTDALMDLGRDLHGGRVAPRSIAEELALEPPVLDAVVTAQAALAAPDMAAFLAGLAPARPAYARLRDALRVMRAYEAAGGWPKVPEDGPKLEPGMSDSSVKALRRRLAVTGELDRALPVTSLYDQPLKAAVLRFQRRHGLEADGVIGGSTLAALNVGASERVESVIANLERERWLPDELGPRHVLVNIPGFDLKTIENGKVVHQMAVIVGTKIRRTPIFASAITSLIWNPTWSVPSKLAREDILPRLRENPAYLSEQHIVLYDGSFAGAKVDPVSIDWQQVQNINRYRLRQKPGTHNALGQVKFNIPNNFDVYLHDTPHREKFVKAVRTFSSGCVRVGDPMALADFVLADMPEWSQDRRKDVLEKASTRFVTLRTPVPVYLLYRTAWVDEDGTIEFREDIYGRDAKVIHAMRRADESVARAVGTTG